MSEVLKPGTLVLIIDRPLIRKCHHPEVIGKTFTILKGPVPHHIPGRTVFWMEQRHSESPKDYWCFARDEFIPIHPDPTECTISETKEFTPAC